MDLFDKLKNNIFNLDRKTLRLRPTFKKKLWRV